MLDVALKEWNVVCDLLAEGKLAMLLRKGGIHEDRGPGRFELDHPRFVLFPSWAHQKAEMIKPAHRDRVEALDEPERITLAAMAEAAGIWEVPDRAAIDGLDDLHCWTAEHIDMRFNYRPEHPLYLVVLRVMRLTAPKTIANRPKYGGCRSWVPLEDENAVDDNAEPVLPEHVLNEIVYRAQQAVGA